MPPYINKNIRQIFLEQSHTLPALRAMAYASLVMNVLLAASMDSTQTLMAVWRGLMPVFSILLFSFKLDSGRADKFYLTAMLSDGLAWGALLFYLAAKAPLAMTSLAVGLALVTCSALMLRKPVFRLAFTAPVIFSTVSAFFLQPNPLIVMAAALLLYFVAAMIMVLVSLAQQPINPNRPASLAFGTPIRHADPLTVSSICTHKPNAAAVHIWKSEPLDFAVGMIQSVSSLMSLPAVQHKALTRPAPENINECYSLLAGLHLLVAEDNMVNAYLLIEQFKLYQTTVTHVLDGRGALEVALQAQRPDVIIMDCQMPEMDGFESTIAIRAAELHQKLTRIPIIAVTALTSASERSRCLNAGMDTHLSKPFEMDALVRMLWDVLP
jgi:CheY-like chemotaxis protein